MLRKRRTELPNSPVDYPAGTFVHTERGYFYIFNSTKRYKMLSKRVLESWAPHRVVETTEAAAGRYRVTAKMKFRNGSLLYSQADGRMYLVSENKIRHITNPDVLKRIGAVHSDAVWVSLSEINLHEEGEPLN